MSDAKSPIPFFPWLLRLFLLAVGVVIAAHTADGIRYDTETALVVAVIVLSVFNLILKPLMVFLTLPFILITFGIGLWFLNALLFLLVGKIVDGFQVDSFTSALWGAFIIGLVHLVASTFSGPRPPRGGVTVHWNRRDQTPRGAPPHKPIRDDKDVIDI